MNLLPKAAMPTPIKTGNRQSPTGQCSNCGVSTLHFLHQVRHGGIQRRLCTSCVLRLHPTSFCPVCFAFYDGVPPHPSKRISCSKCASFTHSHCAATSPLSPYICTPCNNSSPSSFSFFHQTDRVDKKQAVVLLCAARIAASSMSKAAALAKEEAEKKVREAACARKRAREALEHLVWVSNEESARRQEEIWNGNNNNNGVAIAIAIANAKDEEEMDGDFESLVRDLENTLVKEEGLDVAI
ncbi:hypothetical protein SLE2022_141150 [Rubroshorea leprosula]